MKRFFVEKYAIMYGPKTKIKNHIHKKITTVCIDIISRISLHAVSIVLTSLLKCSIAPQIWTP